MKIQNNGYLSIEQLADQYRSKAAGTESRENTSGLSFREVLQQRSRETGEPGDLK